jgi:O-antigen ligase/Flp pilus assembly protein TadD
VAAPLIGAVALAPLLFSPRSSDLHLLKWDAALIGAALLGIPLLLHLWREPCPPGYRSPVLILLLLLLGATLVSIPGARLPEEAWTAASRMAGLTLLAAGAAALAGRIGFLRALWAGLYLPLLLVSLYGLAQALGWEPAGWLLVRRPVSTIGNTNEAAEYVALLLPLPLTAWLTTRGPAAAFHFVVLAAAGAYLVVTGGRGGFLGAAVGGVTALGLLALLQRRGFLEVRWRAKTLPVVVLLIAGFAGTVVWPDARAAALRSARRLPEALSLEGTSTRARLLVLDRTWRMAQDHWLRGVGGGNFGTAFPRYRDPEEWRISGYVSANRPDSRADRPHSQYLAWASESGLPALALYLALLLFAGSRTIRALRFPAAPEHVPFLLALLPVIAALAVLSFTADVFRNPAAAVPLAALLGVAAALTGRGWPGGGRHPALLLLLAALTALSVHGALDALRRTNADRHLAAAALDPPSGVARLREAVRLRPRDPHLWYALAVFLAHTNDRAGAVEAYDRTVAVDPDLVEAWNNRGALHAVAGRREAAEADFRRALQVNRGYAPALRNLANVHLETARWTEAAAELEEAWRLDPSDPETRRVLVGHLGKLAQAARAAEDFVREEQYVARIVEAVPGDGHAQFRLGELLRKRKDEPAALRRFYAARMIFGKEHEEARRLDEALVQYRLADKSDPTRWEPLLGIGACHALRGERDLAFNAIKGARDRGFRDVKALRADPRFESLRAADLESLFR